MSPDHPRFEVKSGGYFPAVASYSLNDSAVTHARQLIDARQYVLDSDWGDVQPSADDQNAFLERHSWDDYASWHLGLTDGANEAPRPVTRSSSATFDEFTGPR